MADTVLEGQTVMVWDPARVTPTPWPGIVDFYRGLEDRNHDFQPLRLLASHVASRPYAASLVGATSGTAMLVAAGSAPDWTRDALRVDLGLDGSIRFHAPESSPPRPGRSRAFQCDGERIVATFERAVRDAGWLEP